MTRPTIDPTSLVSNMQGWDALLRDILNALATTPLPVPQVADFASLPAAGSYDRCICATIDTNKLWFSDGTAWKEVSFV